jgi:hypothetical protein
MLKNVLIGAAALTLGCGMSFGAIIAVGGSVQQIAQPGDARLNVLTSTTIVYAWNEAQNFTLDRNVKIDAQAPGLYDQAGDLINGVLNQGTVVNSHYVHFDTPGSTGGSARGRVQFDGQILGVIVRNAAGTRHLDQSDFLGAPTLFSQNVNARGLEFNTDAFRIVIAGDAIEFEFDISSPGDYMRIITVPTPGSLGLAGVGLLAIARRRR